MKQDGSALVARNRHFETRFERGRVVIGAGAPAGTLTEPIALTPVPSHATSCLHDVTPCRTPMAARDDRAPTWRQKAERNIAAPTWDTDLLPI